MRVEVDGQPYDVPDDATPDEIDQITRPAPQYSAMQRLMGAPGQDKLKAGIAGLFNKLPGNHVDPKDIPVGMFSMGNPWGAVEGMAGPAASGAVSMGQRLRSAIPKNMPDVPKALDFVLPSKVTKLYDLLRNAAKEAPAAAEEGLPSTVSQTQNPNMRTLYKGDVFRPPAQSPPPPEASAISSTPNPNQPAPTPSPPPMNAPAAPQPAAAASPTTMASRLIPGAKQTPQMGGESFGFGPSKLQRGATQAQVAYRAKFLPPAEAAMQTKIGLSDLSEETLKKLASVVEQVPAPAASSALPAAQSAAEAPNLSPEDAEAAREAIRAYWRQMTGSKFGPLVSPKGNP